MTKDKIRVEINRLSFYWFQKDWRGGIEGFFFLFVWRSWEGIFFSFSFIFYFWEAHRIVQQWIIKYQLSINSLSLKIKQLSQFSSSSTHADTQGTICFLDSRDSSSINKLTFRLFFCCFLVSAEEEGIWFVVEREKGIRLWAAYKKKVSRGASKYGH